MPRKPTTGRTGRVLHVYAPLPIAEQIQQLIKSRAKTESQLINLALTIAMPELQKLPMANEAEQAAFAAKYQKRTYKHKRSHTAK